MERECFVCGAAGWLVVFAVVAGGVQEALCHDCAQHRAVLQWFAGEMEGRYWRDRWCVRVAPGAALDYAAEVLRDVLEGPVRRRSVASPAPAVAAGVGGVLVSPQ
ncbi:MAG: hypothetical protein ACTHMU_16480, partial [Thermomicrobiales bacterium]